MIKNWHPISLLNTSYKIISTCITNRLRPLLKTIISPEQKGFLEGRTINECTRIIYDIINESHQQNIEGLILLIDFEKAFDSISWDFIRNTIKKMNFGDSFIKWVCMFHHGSTSKITLNGHYSIPFPLERGCRQGDPISPYLFIICSEILALAIKNDQNLEGIKLIKKEHKLSQYADDTTVGMYVPPWFNLKNHIKWPLFHSLPTRERLQAGGPDIPLPVHHLFRNTGTCN